MHANDASMAQGSTNDRSAKRVKQETKEGSHLHDIIDLTSDVKREASPIYLPRAHVGAVIDLTLEDD